MNGAVKRGIVSRRRSGVIPYQNGEGSNSVRTDISSLWVHPPSLLHCTSFSSLPAGSGLTNPFSIIYFAIVEKMLAKLAFCLFLAAANAWTPQSRSKLTGIPQ